MLILDIGGHVRERSVDRPHLLRATRSLHGWGIVGLGSPVPHELCGLAVD